MKTNQRLSFEEQFFLPYLNRYSTYSFREIIVNNDAIEKGLEADIKELVKRFYSELGFIFKGDYFYSAKAKFKYELMTHVLGNDRTLYITVLRLGKNNLISGTIEKSVNLFGRISRIKLEAPEQVLKASESLINHVVQIISYAYTSLEKAVIDNCEDVNEKLLRRMYSIYENKVRSSNRDYLAARARFFIFKKQEGFFLFDRNAMLEAVQHFKSDQDERHSPFEYIIMLFTNPLPFSKSLTARAVYKEDKTAESGWGKVNFYDEVKFFQAASRLYDFEPYGVTVICEARDYHLSVAFSKSDKRQICKEIVGIRKLLEEEFREGISGFSIFISKINLPTPIQKQKENALFFAEFTGRMIGGALDVLRSHPPA